MKRSKSPLSGVRVIEMTEALAGPYCSMVLGDLGAEVIKVERPGVGDQSRAWGPPFLEGESAYYLSVNRNKRSLELDIKNPDDLGVLHALMGESDVFITNLPRMASLERLGIDPGAALQRHPGLVHVAISGYGHSGPKAGRAGYDLIAQGESGSMALTGGPADGPLRFPTPMADISAGIYAALGVLAALYERDNARAGTGKGQFIDISLVDSQVTWLANVAGSHFATGNRPPKMGNLHPTITPYQPMQARDKVIIVAVGTERLWQRFCTVLGVERLTADARFRSNEDRNRHRSELIPLLEDALSGRDADEWVEALVDEGIPAGPVNHPDQALSDEHLRARRMIVELDHPLIGLVRSIGTPLAMSGGGVTYRRHPPRLGEHNAELRAQAEALGRRR